MKKGRQHWPSFEAKFINETIDSLRRRSKSIKHKVEAFSCDRVLVENEMDRQEKAELSFRLFGAHPIRVSCELWDDRWLWVGVCQSTKNGWLLDWQHEGRVGASSPKEVAETIEKTLWISYNQEEVDPIDELESLWIPIAITGPKGPVEN